MDDVRAVLDAAGSTSAAVFGASEGGNLSILFAATYPERVRALVLAASYAKRVWSPDYPWAPTPEERAAHYAPAGARLVRATWTSPASRPSAIGDPALLRRIATFFRRSASPGAAVGAEPDEHRHRHAVGAAVDRRAHAGAVPHRRPRRQRRGGALDRGSDPAAPRSSSCRATTTCRGVGDTDAAARRGRGVPDRRPPRGPTRPRGWPPSCSPTSSARRRRRPRSATGAGTTCWSGTTRWSGASWTASAAARSTRPATGSSRPSTARRGPSGAPGRSSTRCAELGLEVRAGLHTGEVELVDGKVGGIAVHIGARVAREAGPGEVLVSSTVKDLVVGSGLRSATGGDGAEGRARRVAALRRGRRRLTQNRYAVCPCASPNASTLAGATR